jgi:hypothetical protein
MSDKCYIFSGDFRLVLQSEIAEYEFVKGDLGR